MTPDLDDLDARIAEIVSLLEHEGALGAPFKGKAGKDERRFGSKGSLSILVSGPSRGEWYDHERQEGGHTWALIKLRGGHDDVAGWLRSHHHLGEPEPRRGRRWNKTPLYPIQSTYDYVDEQGRALFQVVRSADRSGVRSFWQRRPGGKGGWIKGRGGARLVLYHLPSLVAAKATGNGHPWRVFLCEGEKDTDRLREQWGLVATTNPGGAASWDDDFDACFAGAEVVLLEDNDKAGRARSATLAPRLARVAVTVRVIAFPHLDEGGDISDWIDAGGTQSDFETLIDGTEPFTEPTQEPDVPPWLGEVKSAGRDYGPIPPRRWLLGTNFCRRFLSGLTGQGAVGKSALRLLQFIAVALGRAELAGEQQVKRTKALLVSFEDDEDELQRRIQAACDGHGLQRSDLDDWLFYWTPRDLQLIEVDHFGRIKPGELGDALRGIIRFYNIGLVGIDPFIKSHGAEENDNSAIDKAASLLLQVAYDCGCACDYIHHQRKGITIAGDPDSGRGASALVNASRLVKTATKMTAAEALELGVSANDRKLLFRLDDAKLNIAPPADQTMWFQLVGFDIGNGNDEYPKGDNVQTVKRWHPVNIWAHVTPAIGNQILDRIDEGPEPGRRYSAAPQAKRAAWIVVQEICPQLTREQAQKVIATWLDTGILVAGEYDDSKERRKLQGVVAGKRPGDTWHFECGSLV